MGSREMSASSCCDLTSGSLAKAPKEPLENFLSFLAMVDFLLRSKGTKCGMELDGDPNSRETLFYIVLTISRNVAYVTDLGLHSCNYLVVRWLPYLVRCITRYMGANK